MAAGDLVWARDEVTGETALRNVFRTFVKLDQPIVEVTLHDGEGSTETFRATNDHPFWTQRGWVAANDLQSADHILRRSGTWLYVAGAEQTGERETVYNFEVEGFHTYFVGDLGAFVHNNSSLKGALDAEVDAAFATGRARSGTMVQFSDEAGALSGTGPREGNGAIWYHDNISIPGAGPNGATVQLRTHAANPNAPAGSFSQSNYTTQINTNSGLYRLPDGQWMTIQSMTPAERAAAHIPAGN